MPTQDNRLAALEAGMAQAEAREEGRLLLARYARALDARDASAMETLFSREAVLIVVPWGIDVRGRDAIMEFFRAYFASDWREPRHYGANQVIAPGETGLHAHSYFHEALSRGSQSVIGWGNWEDDLIFEDGAWRFALRKITVLVLTPVERGWACQDKIMPL